MAAGKLGRALGSAWLTGAVNLALAASLGYALTQGVLRWNAPLALPSPAQTPAAPVTVFAAEDTAAANLGVLRQAHWFGQSNAPAPPRPQAAPDTQLKLELLGILFSDTGQQAKAVIRRADGEAKLFAVGAEVQPGTVLDAVHPDRVILRRGSQLESLRLQPRREGVNLAGPVSQAAPPADSARLAEYRRQILERPESLYDYLRAVPTNLNGRFAGFIVNPGQKPELFQQIGLQAGDIVTAVNGQPMVSSLDGLNALSTLTQARQVQIDILRQGRPQSLSVVLSE